MQYKGYEIEAQKAANGHWQASIRWYRFRIVTECDAPSEDAIVQISKDAIDKADRARQGGACSELVYHVIREAVSKETELDSGIAKG